ncbi:MAG TPA: hypothetical protein DIS90_03890 [Cytophagales bacterium]|nr:hypothetical protein [Cytophagales bacterium]
MAIEGEVKRIAKSVPSAKVSLPVRQIGSLNVDVFFNSFIKSKVLLKTVTKVNGINSNKSTLSCNFLP